MPHDQNDPTSRDFLSQIEVKYGPAGVLGRYLLLAQSQLRNVGVHLCLEPIARMAQLNRENRSSWAPLYPGLDVNFSNLDDSNALCFVGYNAAGEVVAAQGARLYDFTDTTFTNEAQRLTPLYAEPRQFAAKGERFEVRAWFGRLITGRAAYSGGTWVRPDHRGKRLVTILPRLSRTVIMATWKPEIIFGIMAEKLVKDGLLRGNGFRNLEWSVDLSSPTIGDYKFALLWMKPSDVVEDLTEVLSNHTPVEPAKARSA